MCDHSNLLYIISHQSTSWSLDIVSTYRHCQSFLVQIPPSAAFWDILKESWKRNVSPNHTCNDFIQQKTWRWPLMVLEDSISNCLNIRLFTKPKGMKLINILIGHDFPPNLSKWDSKGSGVAWIIEVSFCLWKIPFSTPPQLGKFTISWALFGIMSKPIGFPAFGHCGEWHHKRVDHQIVSR